MGRGKRQKGKIFSEPRASLKTEKVTPWLSNARSASDWLRANSSVARRPKVEKERVKGARTEPSSAKTSS